MLISKRTIELLPIAPAAFAEIAFAQRILAEMARDDKRLRRRNPLPLHGLWRILIGLSLAGGSRYTLPPG
jgi:hypothetical protein